MTSATTRWAMAVFGSVALAVPAAAASASDGGAEPSSGGGATYQREADLAAGGIELAVRRGAYVNRTVSVRGDAPQLAGRRIAIEQRGSRRGGWIPVATLEVARDGRFATAWRPARTGRHQLRAVALGAASAGSGGARAASAVREVTVYKPVVATWYGPGFYGNRTACGQRLTTATIGVAHKTLPCGTRVAVTFRGRSAIVPVIDRGPYARGISYDLTGGLAKLLGVTVTSRIGAVALSR